MKVCVVTGREFFHPFDQRVYKETIALKDAGFEVTLVTPDPDPGRTDLNGINVIKVSNTGRGPTAKRMVRETKKVDCDVYHVHEFDGGYVGATLKVLTGRPVFYDVHDEVPKLLAEMKKNPRMEKIYDKIERQVIKATKGLILAEKSLIPRYGQFNKPVVVINNYPILEMFQCCRLEPEKALKPPVDKLAEKLAGKFTLGYAGGLSVRLGIMQMISGLNELKSESDINLLLVGRFDRKEDKTAALELIHEYKLEKQVIIKGWVEYQKLPAYLDLIDVGLALQQPIPRIKDIPPTKLFDYMACGKPVIANNIPGITRIVDKHHCGILVEPNDSKMFVESVLKLKSSEELCEKLGTAGYNAVRDKYNWGLEAEKLVKFYKEQLD